MIYGYGSTCFSMRIAYLPRLALEGTQVWELGGVKDSVIRSTASVEQRK